jgi:tetratricopeptide (TPR) repeat protein
VTSAAAGPAALPALLAAALLSACAGADAFRCPARGGPAWRELRTDHFLLRTDLPERPAAALAGRLERMRAAVAGALEAQDVPGVVDVIAFARQDAFEPFAPAGSHGYYLRYVGGPPRIVLSGDIVPWQRALLAHELTHHFLAGRYPRQPRWFAEGLAVYLESLGDDQPGGALVVGAPPPDRLERARRGRVPVRELLAWDGRPGRRQAREWYASSWLLVHWLVHARADAFAELDRRLRAGEAPDAAWAAALPEHDPRLPSGPEALDGILARYVAGDLESTRRTVAVPLSVGYREQPMPSAEVHAIRLALWSQGPRKREASLRAEIDEALAEAPAHPVALQLRAGFPGEDAEGLAREAVAAHPDDPRAWTFLGLALGERTARSGGAGEPAAPPPTPREAARAAEREDAYRRAADLAPDNPAALHNLATELDAQGRPGEALPIARRAVELAPWSPPLLASLAAVLSELGRCDEALPLQERALDAWPEGGPEDGRRALEDRRDAYRAQCARQVQR